jgi:hypothetical protein
LGVGAKYLGEFCSLQICQVWIGRAMVQPHVVGGQNVPFGP